MGRKGFTDALALRYGLPVDRYPSTKEELKLAEDALAADLAKMSMVDQEKILFDIHGLPTIDEYSSVSLFDNTNGSSCSSSSFNSDNEDVDETTLGLLNALEHELRKIVDDRKSAYELALYLKPEYVRGKTLQLSFLRCSENDPALAADQIVQHFATKRTLFGSGDVLGRPVLFSDLTPGAVEWIESGCCQILPSRDAAGRIVMFMAAGFSKQDDLEDVSRAIWYIEQVAAMSDEVSATRDGIIVVEYNLGAYGAIFDVKEMEFLYNHSVDGSPIKVAVGHFCYDDPDMESYVAGASIFSDESCRHRARIHFGNSTEEVLFRLQTFGIPTDEFPINEQQTLELGWHREWLACQKKREAPGSGDRSILVPRRFDVLFGRGEGTRVHTGNLRAVHLVEMHFEEYEQAGRREKTAIANMVVSKILESYGRFLKWDEGGWVEVDFDAARDKVSHFFRRRRALKASVGGGKETEKNKAERVAAKRGR